MGFFVFVQYLVLFVSICQIEQVLGNEDIFKTTEEFFVPIKREFDWEKGMDFVEWLEKVNIVFHKDLKLSETDMGVGIVAEEETFENELLFEIPIDVHIPLDILGSILNVQGDVNDMHPYLKNFHTFHENTCGKTCSEHFSSRSTLFLRIWHERFVLKEKSPFHPYFEVLPSLDFFRDNSPFLYNEQRRMALKGTLAHSLIKRARNEIDIWENLFTTAAKTKFWRSRGLTFTRDQLEWVFSIIRTRGEEHESLMDEEYDDGDSTVIAPGFPILIPFADFRNTDYSGFQFNRIRVSQGDSVSRTASVYSASKGLPAGEQILQNPPLFNSLTLGYVYHGVCPEWETRVLVSASFIPETVATFKNSMKKQTELKMNAKGFIMEFDNYFELDEMLIIRYLKSQVLKCKVKRIALYSNDCLQELGVWDIMNKLKSVIDNHAFVRIGKEPVMKKRISKVDWQYIESEYIELNRIYEAFFDELDMLKANEL